VVVKRSPTNAPQVDAVPGFEREPKVYPIDWVDGEWAGMSVSVRKMRYGDLLDGGVTLDWSATGTPRTEFLEGLAATTRALSSVLDSWNLTRKGKPIPATLEGLRSLDEDQAIAIVMTWAVKFVGVSVPLERPSDSGATSPDLSIPTETLSPSLAS
jgi:hypothetical protein